jgi:hypothetical protein
MIKQVQMDMAVMDVVQMDMEGMDVVQMNMAWTGMNRVELHMSA